MPDRLRILLVDDHETVRQGLKRLIDEQADMTVVGEAQDGLGALSQTLALSPDVVVLDLSMPGMTGLAATRRLKLDRPRLAIVILTRHGEEPYLEELFRAGASAYVLKQSPSAEFLQAIRVAAKGGHYIDSAMTHRVTEGLLTRHSPGTAHSVGTLSGRELEVLKLVAVGYSNKEIASRLDLSIKTVEAHKANASRKLDLKGRVDIVRYASFQGWLHDV